VTAPRVSDLEDFLPSAGGGPREQGGPRFALVAAADGFQYALDHTGPRTLTICSSVDAAELEDRIARPGRPRADGLPSKRVVPFPLQGMGVREMARCSGAMITLRSELAAGGNANCKIGRLQTLAWIWPPCLRDRRQTISARQTMLSHPTARRALLVVPAALAAAWASPDWPVLEAAA
jgi:hypothetical protein